MALLLFTASFLAGEAASAQTAAAGKIAFSSERADFNTDIYLINMDATGVQRLTYDPAEDRYPAVSPDGSKVAFISDRGLTLPSGNPIGGSSGIKGNLYVINADGTGLAKLTTLDTAIGAPAWSPDGASIAFTAQDAANLEFVYKIAATGGAPTKLADGSVGVVTWTLGPAGPLIYYHGRNVNLGNGTVAYPYSMKPDGSAQTILYSAPPVYSPDGAKYIAFPELSTMEIRRTSDNSVLGSISFYALNTRVVFSADSQKVVFSGYLPANDNNYASHLFSANVNGTGVTELSRGEKSDDYPSCGPGLTAIIPPPPTGNGRLVLRASDGLYTMYPTGWGARKLAPAAPGIHPNGPFQNPRWSRNGTRIAMDDGKDLFTMAADGSDLQQVTSVASGYSIQPAWNTAGTELAYTNQDGAPFFYHEKIHSVKVDGSGDYVWQADGPTYGSPVWQPSGGSGNGAVAYFRGAAYLESSIGVTFAPQQSEVIWFTNYISEPHNYDSGIGFSSPAWNITGTRLFVVRNERRQAQNVGNQNSSAILSVDSSGGDPRTLITSGVSSSFSAFNSLSFSPDGQSIGYLYGGTLTTLKLDGTSEQRLFGPHFTQMDWGNNFYDASPETHAPAVAFTAPGGTTGWKSLKIEGTLDDSGAFASGGAYVQIKLQRLSDNQYWNPATASWSATPALLGGNAANADSANPLLRPWSVARRDIPPLAQMPNGQYRLLSAGLDNNGNRSTEISTVFTINSPGQFAFSSASYTVNEATGGAISVVRSGGSDGTVTVSYAATSTGTSLGKATADSDFSLPAGTVTFGPGETVKTIPLEVLNDSLLEGDETFQIQLSNPTNGSDFGDAQTFSLSPISAGITIADDEVDKAGKFSFSPAFTVVRSDAGSATIVVARTGGSIPVDINFALGYYESSEARFTDVTQVLHFGAADTSISVNVPLKTTSPGLVDEHVLLITSAPGIYAGGYLLIQDKDYVAPNGRLTFAQHIYQVKDSAGGFDLTIQRIGNTSGSIYTSVGSEQAGFVFGGSEADTAGYSIPSSSASFTDGDSTPKTVHVNITPGIAVSGTKTYRLQLTDVQGYEADVVTLIITHDAAQPGSFTFSQASASATEGAALTLIVNREGGSKGAATVPFTVFGTATRNADYTLDTASPLHFADGETSREIHLQLLADALEDNSETIAVTLGTPTLGTIGSQAAETITINDGPTGASTLTVALTGSGAITPGFLGQSSRKIGSSYTVTATPAAGFLFAGWTGGIVSESPTLTFRMSAGLALTANFAANPFASLTGTYIGLAPSPSHGSDPAEMSVKLTGSGAFTATLYYPASLRAVLPPHSAKLPLKGKFDAGGHYTLTFKVGIFPASFDLRHSPASGGSISGTIAVGTQV